MDADWTVPCIYVRWMLIGQSLVYVRWMLIGQSLVYVMVQIEDRSVMEMRMGL